MLLKRVYNYIMKSLSPSFLIFLAIAFVIWSFNRLGGEFTGVSEIPISISGRVDSIFFDPGREYQVRCNITSKGFSHLLSYLQGAPASTVIPAAELNLSKHPSQSGYYNVDVKSLENALASRFSGGTFISIADSNIAIAGACYSEKRVEIRANTQINLGGLYMQVGKARLEPETAIIYGQKAVIDTVDYLVTEQIVVNNPYNDIEGRIAISNDELYSIHPQFVDFSIDVEQYAEVNFEASVEVFASEDSVATSSYKLMPAKVKVKCNVTRSLYQDFSWDNIVLYVDLSEKVNGGDGYAGRDRYRVGVLSSIVGVEVVDISPKYITVLKRGV